MKLTRIVAILLLICVALAALVSCSTENANSQEEILSINPYEIAYYNYELSDRVGKTFCTTNYVTLYDFSMNNRYIACYDKELNYFAIFNRDNGAVMERSEGAMPYLGYEDKQCIYGGFQSYYYVNENNLKSVIYEDFSMPLNEACNCFGQVSEEIYEASFEDSEFKSNSEIIEGGKKLSESIISLCAAANRDRQVIADNLFYDMSLIDAFYLDSQEYVTYEVPGGVKQIGYNTFSSYNGNDYKDILYPLNLKDTCGIVAATILLQYYERNGIANTIPHTFYLNSYQGFYNTQRISETNYNRTIAARVYNAINRYHTEVRGGSTFVSIKEALKLYFNASGMSNLSATSNIGTANLKRYIDDGDPALIFVSACTIYGAYLDNSNYDSTPIAFDQGHVLYAYGYTKKTNGLVDEYICNAGWVDTNTTYTYGVSFVSKSAIRGNVKLLY